MSNDRFHTFKITRQQLETFSMYDLFCYAKEISSLSKVLGALTCRPRLSPDGQRTQAGDALEALWDFFTNIIDEIQTVALLAQPTQSDEIKYQAMIMLMFHLDCEEEELNVYNMIVAKAMSEIVDAEKVVTVEARQ